jgi:hypothetical protein
MIEQLLSHDGSDDADRALVAALHAYTPKVLATAGRRDRNVVTAAEAEVAADPARAFTFDGRNRATLHALGRDWSAGVFEVPDLATLRARAAVARDAAVGRCRLWVLDGEGAGTDIGALQAAAPPGVLFQVASQFNALEAPGPRVVPVTNYLRDPTQGPRASVSAFPGTLLRHYAAPARDGGRFTQSTDGPQVALLDDAFPPEVARVDNGYLHTEGVFDDDALRAWLEARFESVRVGLHADVSVPLGFNWDGDVHGDVRVAQVFTSTLAGGGYSRRRVDAGALREVCVLLQRAAYLGALLGAVALRQRAAVLTLIGGGVFANPADVIWDAVLWAMDEVDRCAPGPLDVLLNGRTLSQMIPRETLLSAARARGGGVITLPRGHFDAPPAAQTLIR